MQGTHNVYAVELDAAALNDRKLQRLNPAHDPKLPPVYIGMSGLDPEKRFLKHKAGVKSNKFVQQFGKRIMPEHSIVGLKFDEAEKQEELLAKKMRALGYPVVGGNPQMRKLSAFIPPQQERVVRKIIDPRLPGLVLFHGTGSGKTKSSIEAYKALGLPADVIVPAALQENYRKELRKWLGEVPDDVNIVSQQRFANPALTTDIHNHGLQVVDEAQKAKNINSALYRELVKTNPKKRLLLSATPMLNDPSELGALVNLAAGKTVLPATASEFRKRYIRQAKVRPGLLGTLTGVKPGVRSELQNKGELQRILDKYVDYYKSGVEGYPTVEEQSVKVPMGKYQQDIYNSILNKANWWTRYKVKRNIPPNRGELEKMQAFLSGPRQVSNTTAGFTTNLSQYESPKINAAFKYLQKQLASDPTYKGLVYSNYLDSGIRPYAELLKQHKIPYGEFSGAVSARLREQAVRDYNAGKIRALLISGAGAEGLDLKGTRLEQLLDPHWNIAKERQVIGRGARYMSHADLPPEKRKVLVQRYFAKPEAGFWDRLSFNPQPTGTDEYIHNIAQQKDRINQEIVKLIDPQHKPKPWLGWY